MKLETTKRDDGYYECVLTDGKWHALVRITRECWQKAVDRGAGATWDLFTNELAGALGAIDARRENRPTLGSKIHINGQRGRWTILGIKRDGDKGATITARRPVEPEDNLDDDQLEATVPWADCEYA